METIRDGIPPHVVQLSQEAPTLRYYRVRKLRRMEWNFAHLRPIKCWFLQSHLVFGVLAGRVAVSRTTVNTSDPSSLLTCEVYIVLQGEHCGGNDRQEDNKCADAGEGSRADRRANSRSLSRAHWWEWCPRGWCRQERLLNFIVGGIGRDGLLDEGIVTSCEQIKDASIIEEASAEAGAGGLSLGDRVDLNSALAGSEAREIGRVQLITRATVAETGSVPPRCGESKDEIATYGTDLETGVDSVHVEVVSDLADGVETSVGGVGGVWEIVRSDSDGQSIALLVDEGNARGGGGSRCGVHLDVGHTEGEPLVVGQEGSSNSAASLTDTVPGDDVRVTKVSKETKKVRDCG